MARVRIAREAREELREAARCARFPSGVFFRLTDAGDLVVLAILHLARDPSRWMDR